MTHILAQTLLPWQTEEEHMLGDVEIMPADPSPSLAAMSLGSVIYIACYVGLFLGNWTPSCSLLCP